MNKVLNTIRARSRRASAAIEIAVVASLLAVFAALAFNMFMIVYGFNVCDSAARDAARAACSTNSSAAGLIAAQQAALTNTTDGIWVSQPTVANTPTDCQYITTPGIPTEGGWTP